MDSVYLDHAATTPLDPEVFAAMKPYLLEEYGNASSVHQMGRRARVTLEEARERVADCLGAESSEIVFTSGGTEADNLALKGILRERGQNGHPAGLVTSAAEHEAVLRPAERLAEQGHPVTILTPDDHGAVSADQVDAAIDEHEQLVERLLNKVYDTPLEEVEEITRSTVSQTDSAQYDIPKIASDPRQLRGELQQIGVELEDGEVGGHVQLDGELSLNALAIGLGLENIEYEPERFPAVIYHTALRDAPATTVVLFGDGRITAVDAPSEAAVRQNMTAVVQQLQDLGLWEGKIPEKGSIAISERNS